MVRATRYVLPLFALSCSVWGITQGPPQATPMPTPTPAAAQNKGSIASGLAQIVGQKLSDAPMRGDVETLSDTMGVNFGPYLKLALYRIKKNWYYLIPEVAKPPLMKQGSLIIQFAILKDGGVAGMVLQKLSGDVYLDRAAWGGITTSDPFERLPAVFSGDYLALRIKFVYNPKGVEGATAIDSPPFFVPFGVHAEDFRPLAPASLNDPGAANEPAAQGQKEDIKVISDTLGVDFSGYLERLVSSVREHWYKVIPDAAKRSLSESGTVVIRFAVLRDGTVARMRHHEISGNANLDQAAWQSIVDSSPFPPLPKQFTGADLVVSVRFQYNPKTEEKQNGQNHMLVFSSEAQSESKSHQRLIDSAVAWQQQTLSHFRDA